MSKDGCRKIACARNTESACKLRKLDFSPLKGKQKLVKEIGGKSAMFDLSKQIQRKLLLVWGSRNRKAWETTLYSYLKVMIVFLFISLLCVII